MPFGVIFLARKVHVIHLSLLFSKNIRMTGKVHTENVKRKPFKIKQKELEGFKI